MKLKRSALILSLIFAAMLAPPRGIDGLAKEAGGGFRGSLLFSSAEQQAITQAMALRPAETGSLAPGGLQVAAAQPVWSVNRLHLSALIYTDNRKWTLWLEDRQVRPDAIPPFLQDVRVYSDYVDVSLLPHPGTNPIPVRLRLNQTFLANQNRIIDDAANTK